MEKVNITTLLGGLGSGKTLTAVTIIVKFREKFPDSQIYSNINLKMPFTPIEDTDFFNEVDNQDHNIILIDEIGEMRTGVTAIMFDQKISQARKKVGEKTIMLLTTQVKNQTNQTLRGTTTYMAYPEIFQERFNPQLNKKEPVTVKVEYQPRIPRTYPPQFDSYNPVLKYYNVIPALGLYNTYEEVSGLSDGSYKYFFKKYAQYLDSETINITGLTTLIQMKEGISNADARRKARLILNASAWGLV